MKTPRVTGRAWAYISLTLGGTVSIAANVAHSYVPPAAAAAGWAPHAGAVASAIVWPVFLFAAIETLARVAWPGGWWWGAVRYGGLVPVALVAAVVSYRHLSGLLAYYGEDALTVRIGPLAVDGLMVMATGALIATSALRRAIHDDPAPVVEPLSAAPVSPAGPADRDATVTTPTARPKRATPAPKAAAVAKAAKALPNGTAAQIAARAGASEATARRHLRDRAASDGYGRDAAAMAGDWPVGRVNGSATVGGSAT